MQDHCGGGAVAPIELFDGVCSGAKYVGTRIVSPFRNIMQA